MKHFFLAHTYLDLQLGDQSISIYSQLLENGFSNSTYVIGQLAVAYDNTKSKNWALNDILDALGPVFMLNGCDDDHDLIFTCGGRFMVALSNQLARKTRNINMRR